MRRTVLVVAVMMCISVPVFAADKYAFHIRVTDGRTGLLSNPDFQKLGISEEQLEKAAKHRVVVMNEASGTRWHWLMLSWFDNKPEVEQALNERGSAGPDKADIAISSGSAGHLRIRCLRDECRISVRRPEHADTQTELKRGEQSQDIPLDSSLTFSFATAENQ